VAVIKRLLTTGRSIVTEVMDSRYKDRFRKPPSRDLVQLKGHAEPDLLI